MIYDTVYVCNTNMNKKCNKTFCHINGGECRHTKHILYALYKDHTEFECMLSDGRVYRQEKVRDSQ